jgi:hypothetical protein
MGPRAEVRSAEAFDLDSSDRNITMRVTRVMVIGLPAVSNGVPTSDRSV